MPVLLVLMALVLFCPALVGAQALDRTHASISNVLEYGAACNSTTLSAAVSALGAQETMLMLTRTDAAEVNCTWTLTSNITIPTNISLWIPHGVRATISAGMTLTACVDAGPYEIFGGPGAVVLPSGCTGAVQALWFAKTAIGLAQANAAAAANGVPLYLGPGNWAVASNTTISSSLVALPGGLITLSGGVTLAFNKPIQAPCDLRFMDVTNGVLAFGGPQKTCAAWVGAIGDASTDNYPRLQKLLDGLGAAGGGDVEFVPGTYHVLQALRMRDNVVLRGSGFTTHLRNANTNGGANRTQGALFLFGNIPNTVGLDPASQIAYPAQNIVAGDATVTFTTPGNENNFSVGMVVFIGSSVGDTDASSGHFQPKQFEMNEIVGIVSGKIQLKYPASTSITGATVFKLNSALTTEAGEPLYVVKRAGVENMQLSSSTVHGNPSIMIFGGNFESFMRHVWVTEAASAFVMNAASRFRMEDIRVSNISNNLFDLAFWSHNNYFARIGAGFREGVAATPRGCTAGENARDNVYEFMVLTFPTNLNHVVAGCRFQGPNNVLRNSTIRVRENNQWTIFLDDTGPNNPSFGNIIENNRILVDAGTAPEVIRQDPDSVQDVRHPNIVRGNYIDAPRTMDAVRIRHNMIVENNNAANNPLRVVLLGTATFAQSGIHIRNNTLLNTAMTDTFYGTENHTKRGFGGSTGPTFALRSYTIPAGVSVLGQKYVFNAWGNTTGNGATKDFKLTINGTQFAIMTVAPQTQLWRLQIEYITGTQTSQAGFITMYNGSTTTTTYFNTAIDNDVNDMTFALTYSLGVASDDVNLREWTVRTVDDPPGVGP